MVTGLEPTTWARLVISASRVLEATSALAVISATAATAGRDYHRVAAVGGQLSVAPTLCRLVLGAGTRR